MSRLGLSVLAVLVLLSILFAVSCKTTEPPPKTYTIPELKYKLIDNFDDVFWCDPDYYPIGSAERELENALEQFAAIKADAEEFAAILKRLSLDDKESYTDEEKLLVYRQHKLLTYALTLQEDGSDYIFTLRVGEGEGESIEGTISSDGDIRITKREPSINTCPICLTEGTLIDTPQGALPVEQLKAGMTVWTLDASGNRVAAPILRVSSTPLPTYFKVLRVTLDDGRTLAASPGHPSAEGRPLSSYGVGESLDGAVIVSIEHEAYIAGATYDILPSGDTGFYWANGVLLGSTLKD